ncbi:MAG: DoxX family protein [Acidimicrobiia bacterium]|nr:DoxX family protein [Acidimicrobiia bacterium]
MAAEAPGRGHIRSGVRRRTPLVTSFLTWVRDRTTRLNGPAAWIPTVVRVGAGAFFLSTGAGKFLDHAHEVAEFRRFEVPLPEIAVPAVGLLELVAGALLVVGLLVRPSAIALALNMVGALLTAGRVVGGSFHLVYAPLLLVAMIFLAWVGPGRASLDERARAAATGARQA